MAIELPNSNTVKFTLSNLVPNSNAILYQQNGDEIEVWILVDEWTMVTVRNEHTTVDVAFHPLVSIYNGIEHIRSPNSYKTTVTWT